MITSIKNPKVKTVRDLLSQKKKRDEAQSFIVEGIRLGEEALAAGLRPALALYSSAISDRGKQLVANLDSRYTQIEEVDEHILNRISDTETSQGLLMVCSKSDYTDQSYNEPVLVIDQVRDPGNLGTILRSASAFGFQTVIMTPGSTDPFSPKVLRAGMGAQFKLQVLFQSAQEIGQLCKNWAGGKLNTILADTQAEVKCWEIDFTRPLCLIIGGEAFGAETDIKEIIDERVLIPMQANNESLNAAMAASILMYEVQRQREVK